MKLGDLIYIQKNNLDRDFCDKLIEKFNSQGNKKPGIVGGGFIPEIKQSIDLNITFTDGYDYEDSVLSDSLTKAIQKYINFARVILNGAYGFNEVEDTGFQIQRTEPNEFYTWHHDASLKFKSRDGDNVIIQKRLLTYIWYLNDIKENGYTEFIDGTRVQPETGTLVMFPSEDIFVHRGYPPKSEVKYICTGWVWQDVAFNIDEFNEDVPPPFTDKVSFEY